MSSQLLPADMARHESDREDLFAELTSYVPRWEIELTGPAVRIVVGSRENDRWQIYTANADYFQFLPEGPLRRAFRDGVTLLSKGSTLVQLIKQRTDRETRLLRTELSPHELDVFLREMRWTLAMIATELESGQFKVLRSMPVAADPSVILLPLLQQARHAHPALSPGIARE